MLLKDKLKLDPFSVENIDLTKYLFFTGKGGVGKTSVACSVAVNLADCGHKVFLISTDPASNLQDVFNMELSGTGIEIAEVKNLKVANLDPVEAAKEYKESVVGPYRGKLPDAVIANMEEQLSGSCTVEIAAFDQFSKFISDSNIAQEFDYIIFDTAPTGHTLRMLQLPSAWSNFISESNHGASCLGQLSGLEEKKEIYKKGVETLCDKTKTTLILVARAETTSFLEVKRSSSELSDIGIDNQMLIVNGVLNQFSDNASNSIYDRQIEAIENRPKELDSFPIYSIPLKSFNLIGIENLRNFFQKESPLENSVAQNNISTKSLSDLIDDLHQSSKKVIFTMGKGGVGKTSIASSIAKGLSQKGEKVLLTTTDPANHLIYEQDLPENITISSIDEKKELERYSKEVLSKAKETMSGDDIAYIEEDLRSPCTQEIAVFRAFAEVVEKADESVVVIDTAPTGHTLLLLDSSLSYHKEVERSKGEIPESVKNLLPRLRDKSQTEVVIVTLAEATPVFEAERLKKDLERANIQNRWWVVNKSLLKVDTTNPVIVARSQNEIEWIEKVQKISNNLCAVVPLDLTK